jgi:hypothetical protein
LETNIVGRTAVGVGVPEVQSLNQGYMYVAAAANPAKDYLIISLGRSVKKNGWFRACPNTFFLSIRPRILYPLILLPFRAYLSRRFPRSTFLWHGLSPMDIPPMPPLEVMTCPWMTSIRHVPSHFFRGCQNRSHSVRFSFALSVTSQPQLRSQNDDQIQASHPGESRFIVITFEEVNNNYKQT